MAVDLVTIHHEGAGTPSDVARGADGGYTEWIGATRFERLRPVSESYATLHFNHVSLDICLSGNRMVSPVTDNDIALIHAAFMDAHDRGEVVDVPRVQAHRDNNGKYMYHGSIFSTVCPGDRTMARWAEVVGSCRVPSGPPPLTQAQIARYVALDDWRHRVHRKPLRFGDKSSEVAFLVNEFRRHHFLGKDVVGDKFGRVLRTGNVKFKDAVPELRDQPAPDKGEKFGGDAADALVALG